MSLLSLDLKPQLAVPLRRDLGPIRLRVTFDNLGRGLLPGRGLLYSFLAHELIVITLLFWPAYLASNRPHPQRLEQPIDLNEVIYLPKLGGGSEGNGYSGGGSVIQRRGSAVTPTRASKGFSYPGPQAILSDPQKPTTQIQTILRPELKNPPVLRSFVPIPNIVQASVPVSLPLIADKAQPVRPVPQLSPMRPKMPIPTDVRSASVPNVQPASTSPLPSVADNTQPVRPLPQLSPMRPKTPTPTDLKSASVPNVLPAPASALPSVANNTQPVRPLPQLSPMRPKTPTPRDLKSASVPNVLPAPASALPSVANNTQPVRPLLQLSQMKPKTPGPTEEAVEPIAPMVPVGTTNLAEAKLPAADTPKVPLLPPMGMPRTVARKSEDLQRAPNVSAAQAQGTELQSLLALSPSPALPQQPINVPPGESRGRFAISPEPNLGASRTGPGSKIEDSPSPTVAVGNAAAATPGNAAALGPTGVNNGSVRLAIGGTGGLGTSTGSGTGAGNGGDGIDNGHGSAAGARLGEGPRGSSGGGTGAGAGKGGGAFAGMTIQGGSLQGVNGGSPVSPTSLSVAPTSSYGMTIVSTASSGGGLPDFGVFSHEQVYTVYLDMRRTPTDSATTWTLQCALLQSTDAQDIKTSSQALNGLVPPFPINKEQPDLLPDLVRQDVGKLVVVYGIVAANGKFQELSMKQSPDPKFNGPVLQQLANWVFRPAELNGTPVAVKVLIGFSLSLPDH